MPIVLALLSSALWGLADFLGGTATRRLPAPVVVGASQLVALVCVLPFAMASGSLTTAWDPSRAWPGVAAGLVGVLALGAFYAALATGTMGVIAPLAALGALLPVGVGLARGESPSALQLVGIAVAILGVVLASGPELAGGAALRPLLLAGCAAVGFGAVAVLLAEGSRQGSGGVVATLLVMRSSSVAVLLCALGVVTAARRHAYPTRVVGRDLGLIGAIGVTDVGANASFALASRSGLLSVVAVLASLYPVVTVLLARQVHAERLQPIQLVGAAGTLGGVALLALG